MKISIILPVYNVEAYLEACIDSVLAQTYPNFELIAINDGSTDNSLEILKKYKDERILIFEQENRGTSATLNRGIQEAEGDYVAFIDGDDLWVSDKLETQVKIFEENPNLEMSFGKFEQFLSEEIVERESKFIFEQKPASALMKQTSMAKRGVFEKYGRFNDNNNIQDFIPWFDNARTNGLKYQVSEKNFAFRRIRENSLSQSTNYYPTLLRFMKEKLDKKRNEAGREN